MNKKRQNPMHIVLKVRANRERSEERALALVLAEKYRAELNLGFLQGERERISDQRQAAVGSVHTGAELIHGELACQELHINIAAAHADLQTAEQKRTHQTAIYHDARREREVISDLLHQQMEARRKALEQSEQRRAADLFLARFAQKRHTIGKASCDADEPDNAVDDTGVFSARDRRA